MAEDACRIGRHGISAASLGPDHPNVVIRLNNLVELLRETCRLPQVESLYRRALGIVETSLGADHPNSVTVRENYAVLLAELEARVVGAGFGVVASEWGQSCPSTAMVQQAVNWVHHFAPHTVIPAKERVKKSPLDRKCSWSESDMILI